MCVHKNVLEYTNCESGITTETSTPDTNSTINDGKSYGLEMDIRSGYHMIMSRNSTYDNVSNQRILQLTYCQSTFVCFTDEYI
jgi:hypothetical protein